MSATFARPPPTPGLDAPVQPRSCLPKPVVSGDPTLSPWPGMVRRFPPSISPAFAPVWLIRVPFAGAPPGKVKNLEAMLPLLARASNAGVSYQPFAVLCELLRTVSDAKTAQRE